MDVTSKDATPLQFYFEDKAEKTLQFKKRVQSKVRDITREMEDLRDEIQSNILDDSNKDGFLKQEMDGCLSDFDRVI